MCILYPLSMTSKKLERKAHNGKERKFSIFITYQHLQRLKTWLHHKAFTLHIIETMQLQFLGNKNVSSYWLNRQEKLSNTWEQFPLTPPKVVSLDDQQHCSMFSQKASGQIPNLRSLIHELPISMIPATVPVTKPTRNTHSHPDQASWAPLIVSKKEFFFFLTIYRWRIRSRAMSRCQSMVWKSSYCPMPGISSESVKFVGFFSDKVYV